MVFVTPYPWYIKPHPMVFWTTFLVKWGGSIYHAWWVSKYNDLNLTPGSKYHIYMVYWTQGRFFRGSKYRVVILAKNAKKVGI
jgi:hypothetical protein